jgi:peptide/nickel transport system substrate-binding protein
VTRGFALNPQVPPFDDIRVRRALNYAVDRTELVRISGGPQLNQVSCQILPPDFPGYQPYCPYTLHPSASGTWSAPDPGLAQRLVAASGTRGAQITVWAPRHFPYESEGRYLVSILDGLGYRARLHVLGAPNPYFHEISDPHVSAAVQISFYPWLADYPAPSGFAVPLFACASVPASPNPSHFCDGRVQTEMNKALAVQASDPAAAGEAWAGVDRSIVDQAPWLALPTPLQVYFVSTRTSNVQVSPQWGMLLSQLWIH